MQHETSSKRKDEENCSKYVGSYIGLFTTSLTHFFSFLFLLSNIVFIVVNTVITIIVWKRDVHGKQLPIG